MCVCVYIYLFIYFRLNLCDICVYRLYKCAFVRATHNRLYVDTHFVTCAILSLGRKYANLVTHWKISRYPLYVYDSRMCDSRADVQNAYIPRWIYIYMLPTTNHGVAFLRPVNEPRAIANCHVACEMRNREVVYVEEIIRVIEENNEWRNNSSDRRR